MENTKKGQETCFEVSVVEVVVGIAVDVYGFGRSRRVINRFGLTSSLLDVFIS